MNDNAQVKALLAMAEEIKQGNYQKLGKLDIDTLMEIVTFFMEYQKKIKENAPN